VRSGDLIVALEGNEVTSYDTFGSFMEALDRPVRITFCRPNKLSSSSSSGDSSSRGDRSMGGMGGMDPMGLFRSAPPPKVLSEQEKTERRARMSAAAQTRTQAWDKKLSQKKRQNRDVDSGSGMPDPAPVPQAAASRETEAAIVRAKQLEVHTEAQLGYSPFRPHMSFSGNAAAGAPGNASGSGSSKDPSSAFASAATQDDEEVDVDEEAEAEVDDAFAMLLSLGEGDQQKGQVAAQTVLRMLGNLSASAADPRLRSIRVSNRAFQAKVAAVPGGAELLQAAGYAYQAAPDSLAGGDATAAVGEAGEEELFLVHPMDAHSRRRLLYTERRIHELLESARAVC